MEKLYLLPEIKNTSIIKDFTDKMTEISEIPNINEGGCAIVAHAGLSYLKNKCPDINADIYYLYKNEDINYIKDISVNKPVSCSHAVIKIGDHLYDCEGHRELGQDDWLFNWLNIEVKVDIDLVYASIHKGTWNPTFNREKYCETINEIFDTKINYLR